MPYGVLGEDLTNKVLVNNPSHLNVSLNKLNMKDKQLI